jgi:steroid 5-alpha reductase family enzyme
MLVTWAISIPLRNAAVIDVVWGLGCAAVAWVAFAVADGAEPRKVLVVALASAWGVRLAVHLGVRTAREREEDFRYRELRERYGRRFRLVSLFRVFLFQGAGMWVVTLPLQAAQVPDSPSGLTVLDFAGVALWTAGMFFEVVGDAQLARFRADPANRGQVMDRGLWSWTRHPNYFGEACIWWGFWLIALATGEAWWSVAGPLMITFVLLRMSGVALMEPHLRGTRPGYEDYVRRVSAFVPRPPRPRR